MQVYYINFFLNTVCDLSLHKRCRSDVTYCHSTALPKEFVSMIFDDHDSAGGETSSLLCNTEMH